MRRMLRESGPIASPRASPVPAIKLVVSDLHLGDGDPASENWGTLQQDAWERLLAPAAPAGAPDGASVELIVNGDAFDFLVSAPDLAERSETDAAVGAAKIERIIAAHPAWFAALREFLRPPDRAVTFLIGNHDLELAFAPVRARIRRAIDAPVRRVRFCLARAFRPLPDVEIEHGCQFDPWNRISGLWDEPGALTASPRDLETRNAAAAEQPARLELPFGSRYYYEVFGPIQRRFPYFDQFLPSLPQVGILAVACLFAPRLIIAGAARSRSLYAGVAPDTAATARKAAEVAAAAEQGTAALFEAILPDVVALQSQVWQCADAALDAAEAAASASYVQALLAGLAADERSALRAVLGAPDLGLADMAALDAGASTMLDRAAGLRLALCGHSHVEGMHHLLRADGTASTYVNTGTWFSRLTVPRPASLDDAAIAWLRAPRTGATPLASATAFTYALLRATPGEPTTVSLGQVNADPP